MQNFKLALLAALMTLHAIAGTGEEDLTPHTHSDPIEAIQEARRDEKE
jgi:hypothetical protein